MSGILKFGIFFVLCSVVLAVLGTSITLIFDLFGSSLSYISTGNIGIVITSLAGYVGWFLDLLFLGSFTGYTTHFGAIEIASLSWVLTFARVVFGLSVFVVLLSLIFNRS